MPPALDPPTNISLKVKVPIGYLESGDEFVLGTQVPVNATLAAVRGRIQATIPTHPAPSQQRLLYGGRALVDDEQTLADALNIKRDPTQLAYVIHLVVKGGDIQQHQRGRSNVSTNNEGSQSQSTPQAESSQQEQQARHTVPQPQGLPQPPAIPHGQTTPFNPVAAAMQHHHNLHNHIHNGIALPPHLGIPTPLQGQTFGQTVHQGQQQRAAAGRTGVFPGFPQQQQPQPQVHDQAQGNIPAASPPTEGHTQPGSSPFAAPPPRRPLSNQGFHVEGTTQNGQHFTIDHQSFAIPIHGAQHAGAGLPFNVPGMNLPGMFNGVPLTPDANRLPFMGGRLPRRDGPTALEQARENVAEMRRFLDQMRTENNDSEERQRQIQEMQERTQRLEDYIDPMHLGRTAARNGTDTAANPATATNVTNPLQEPRLSTTLSTDEPSRSASVPPRVPLPAVGRPQVRVAGARLPPPPMFPRSLLNPLPQQPSTPGRDVTCYLLSNPTGPQAILFSPEHGRFVGSLPSGIAPPTAYQPPRAFSTYRFAHPGAMQPVGLPPGVANDGQARAGAAPNVFNAQNANGVVPTPPAVAGNDQGRYANVAVGAPHQQQQQQQRQQQAQAQAQPAEPNAFLQPLFAHFWLLVRILIFAYFLLGTDMGWQRPVALLLIGAGFMLIRAGLFGDGGMVRRWWEGIVRIDDHRQDGAGVRNDGLNQQGEQGVGNGAAAGGNGAVRGDTAARMPTPEEVAERLVREQREQAPAQQGWWREQIRPVERVLALLIASLWPGVGEAQVRARREADRRRRREEEEAERRRAEGEERRRQEEEATRNTDDGESQGKQSATGEEQHEGNDIEPGVSAHASGVETQEGGEIRRRGSVSAE